MAARITVTLDELVRLRADARGFSLLPRQPLHSLLSGRHASRLRGRGLDFEELRRYAYGDDVRSIDWRATARMRKPHVRVYEHERERPVLLLVDQRNPMFFASRRAMKSVVAAEIAALLAWRGLDAGDRVGGIVFNEAGAVELAPRRSQGTVLRLLGEVARLNQALASRQPPAGTYALNDALGAAVRHAVHDHVVVLVGDLDGADATTEQLATRLAAHNDLMVIAVYDPLGASLVGQHGMFATDRGLHLRIPEDAAFAAAFRREFERGVSAWAGIFRALRVPVLPLSTASGAAEQIRTLFGHGGRSPA